MSAEPSSSARSNESLCGRQHKGLQKGKDLAERMPLVLVVVAAVACWVPARRAAWVDPAIALSAE